MWFYQINSSHNTAHAYLLQHAPLPPPPRLTKTEKKFNAVFTENVHLDAKLVLVVKFLIKGDLQPNSWIK